jgi:hypothetical protein
LGGGGADELELEVGVARPETPLGAETPEARRRGQTLDEAAAILGQALAARGPTPDSRSALEKP